MSVAGRLMGLRHVGKLAFGVLQDVSGRIQLFVNKAILGEDEFERFLALDSGDWIGATFRECAPRSPEVAASQRRFSVARFSLKSFSSCFWYRLSAKKYAGSSRISSGRPHSGQTPPLACVSVQ